MPCPISCAIFSNSEGKPPIRWRRQSNGLLISFYPIFPAPLDVAHEVNLDVTHSEGIKLMESEDEPVPNVLVLPSRLKQFSKASACVRVQWVVALIVPPGGGWHDRHQSIILVKKFLRDVILCWPRIRSSNRPHNNGYI